MKKNRIEKKESSKGVEYQVFFQGKLIASHDTLSAANESLETARTTFFKSLGRRS